MISVQELEDIEYRVVLHSKKVNTYSHVELIMIYWINESAEYAVNKNGKRVCTTNSLNDALDRYNAIQDLAIEYQFKNEDRLRVYGKRKGDIVFRYNTPGILCEVTSIDFGDNNRFEIIELQSMRIYEDTPEHYEIKTKVEDI